MVRAGDADEGGQVLPQLEVDLERLAGERHAEGVTHDREALRSREGADSLDEVVEVGDVDVVLGDPGLVVPAHLRALGLRFGVLRHEGRTVGTAEPVVRQRVQLLVAPAGGAELIAHGIPVAGIDVVAVHEDHGDVLSRRARRDPTEAAQRELPLGVLQPREARREPHLGRPLRRRARGLGLRARCHRRQQRDRGDHSQEHSPHAGHDRGHGARHGGDLRARSRRVPPSPTADATGARRSLLPPCPDRCSSCRSGLRARKLLLDARRTGRRHGRRQRHAPARPRRRARRVARAVRPRAPAVPRPEPGCGLGEHELPARATRSAAAGAGPAALGTPARRAGAPRPDGG